jgi:hypothetical protein
MSASKYTTAGTAVWLGTSRIICEADTDTMAKFIAAALNNQNEKAPTRGSK